MKYKIDVQTWWVMIFIFGGLFAGIITPSVGGLVNQSVGYFLQGAYPYEKDPVSYAFEQLSDPNTFYIAVRNFQIGCFLGALGYIGFRLARRYM